MDTKLKRYYRKKMSGGRSMIARALDFIMLRTVILAVIFIVMLQLSRSISVAAPIAVLVTAAICIIMHLYWRKKAERYLENDLKRISGKCMLEELTLMSDEDYIQYMACIFCGLKNAQHIPGGFLADYQDDNIAVLHNHPKSICGVSEIVAAYRIKRAKDGLCVVSLSGFSDDAKKFAESASIRLIDGSDVLRIAGEKNLLPDKTKAEQRARQEMEETAVSMERVRRYAFSRARVRAYILCGLVTLIWPLFGIWRIYYPIISLLCFILAVISYKRGKLTQENTGDSVT